MCDQKSYEAKPDSKETPKPTLIDELTAVKKKYEDLAKEAKIKETQGAKRKPLPDGTLPMTDQELEEFGEIVKDRGVYRVWIDENDVACYKFKKGIYHMNGNAVKIKAILWLAERFELEGEK